MDEPAEIGRRVQRLRTERGLTQRQLAEPSYSAAYVSTLESGKVRPSETALRFLAGRLDVSYEELVTGRPAHLATELRLGLTDAQRALATGAADEAADRYLRLLAEAERLGLPAERAEALLGLGDCALESGELTEAVSRFEAAERLLEGEPLHRRARPIRGRAVALLLAGELRYACYLLESTIDELNAGGLPDPEALVLLYAAVIGPYIDMGAHARAAHAAELALALAPGSAIRRWSRACTGRWPGPSSPRGGPPTPMPRSPRPRRSTGSCGWGPTWRTATGCGGTYRRRTANCTRRSGSCARRGTCWRRAGPRSTRRRSRWSWPTCCGASAGTRRRRSSCRSCWSWATGTARCTRAGPTGCSG